MVSHTEISSLGLSSDEADLRLKCFGQNEISIEKKGSILFLLIEQFKSPLVLILVGACVLSLSLGESIEAIAIAAIVVLNAAIGFIQEYRAETAIAALKRMTAPRATVIRDGRKQVIGAKDVVAGDLIYLEAGDLVAADGKIRETSDLLINESVLTGESLPVEKYILKNSTETSLEKQSNRVFMGTSVMNGNAIVQVTETGMKTELGKIARLLTTAESGQTPLQLQLRHLGKVILFLCFIIVGVVLLFGIAEGRSWFEQVIFSISLAVAVVPEGLPAIVTVALALGVKRMASRNALVRKLPSVEILGSVSVICTDKTGTLTTGDMRVREIWGEDHDQVILTATSCCEAELGETGESMVGDPTEIAILLAAKERGIDKTSIEKQNPRLDTHPFDSIRKMMSIYRYDHKLYVKGAFDHLVHLCKRKAPSDRLMTAEHAHREMNSRGLRVLGIARGDENEERQLELVGLLGIADPPRTEVREAIREARGAGILPIMITGDHPITALAIARELELLLDNENPSERVYARVTPEDKLKLIRHWKNKGAVVAMTGDGVNDAPALREADIGIAMGKMGTEVTRQAADLILADDNFATIIAAVKEGRGVYRNIRKAITYLLTGNMGELLVVLGASIFGLPLPFMAVHLLWINLVTDALPALALIADAVPNEILKQKPRDRLEPLLRRSEWGRIFLIGLVEAGVVLGLFKSIFENYGVESARNLTFTTIVFSQMFRSFGASREHTLWQVGIMSNLWLLGVVIITLGLQVSLHFLPIGQKVFGLRPLVGNELVLIFVLALIPITVIELSKIFLAPLEGVSQNE